MPPKVRTCRRCNKMFQDVGNPYCYECLNFIDEQYVVIRDYLYDNPSAGFEKVVEDAEVERDILNMLIKQGRISFSAESGQQYVCQGCGKLNSAGRLCERCQQSAQAFSDIAKAVAPKPDPKKAYDLGKRQAKMHTDRD